MPNQRDLIAQISKHLSTLAQAATDAQTWHDRWLAQATATHQQETAAAQERLQQATIQARSLYAQQTQTATSAHQQQVAKLEADYKQATTASEAAYQQVMSALLAPNYQTALHQEGVGLAAWSDPRWANWQASLTATAPTVTRLGNLIDSRTWHKISLPASLPFIGGQSLLWKSKVAARSQAVKATQSFLLRLAATLPPAKLRFTFIDPVGLGQNAAPLCTWPTTTTNSSPAKPGQNPTTLNNA